MIHVEIATRAENLNPQINKLHNNLVYNTDFVFTVYTEGWRKRCVVPAGAAATKRVKPRRARAEIIEQCLKIARRDGYPLSWRDVDQATIDVMREDGCDAAYLFFRSAASYIRGFATKLWRYWYVPKLESEQQK